MIAIFGLAVLLHLLGWSSYFSWPLLILILYKRRLSITQRLDILLGLTIMDICLGVTSSVALIVGYSLICFGLIADYWIPATWWTNLWLLFSSKTIYSLAVSWPLVSGQNYRLLVTRWLVALVSSGLIAMIFSFSPIRQADAR